MTNNFLYEEANWVLIFLALQVFFTTLSGVIGIRLLGKDEVDINQKSKFKDYLKNSYFELLLGNSGT